MRMRGKSVLPRRAATQTALVVSGLLTRAGQARGDYHTAAHPSGGQLVDRYQLRYCEVYEAGLIATEARVGMICDLLGLTAWEQTLDVIGPGLQVALEPAVQDKSQQARTK
jgi:hypothetical protein